MRICVGSLSLLSGSRIWHCSEPWCRLQTWLRSGIAVAVAQAGSCNSNLAPSLGISIWCRCGPKKQKKKKKKKPGERGIWWKRRQADRWMGERTGWSPTFLHQQCANLSNYHIYPMWSWFCQMHMILKSKRKWKSWRQKRGMTFFQYVLLVRRKSYLNFFQYICSISEWSAFAWIFCLFGFGACWSKKPPLTHSSMTVTVYYISSSFKMPSSMVVCHTRQSHNLHAELVFLKNKQNNKSAHVTNFPLWGMIIT